MATPAMPTTPASAGGVNGDTLVILKVLYAGQNRRFKLALRDLGAQVLPQKVRVTECFSLISPAPTAPRQMLIKQIAASPSCRP